MKSLGCAPADFFDLKGQGHEELFASISEVWEILPKISAYLQKHLPKGSQGKLLGQPVIGKDVYLGEGTIVEPGAYIRGMVVFWEIVLSLKIVFFWLGRMPRTLTTWGIRFWVVG